ncbi:hypothetical protein WT19_06975 [Burkholderia stagnalis]|uniref:Porin n=1 Tax=Burkholderia stagnalis TaxID=1503054 RepID=A0A3N7S9Z1_9BURK|nr:porin [Burkholderia stagnalis]KAB0633799.1 porin [Burkholderia stagnalis]KVL88704.1 hypothetical protein WT03_24565 [Burkholderia stagnalis]KVO34709.1 hypothetical protein WT17_28405 [Burkholderia stagnalis]KVO78067.1 hypothetical protein WT19_06975 [Burkholderia stagnalis]KVW56733.1 hypothetical protein WT28_00840 [Burkholderia stagnalis]
MTTTKTLICLGILPLCLEAHGQSSVTLYGMADAGLTYTNNQGGASRVQTWSGSRGSSRFGFRGTENLGGGLKAIFGLENGFDIQSGKSLQNGRLFGRQSWVGLTGDFGTVTLGRQSDIVFDVLGAYETGILMAGSLGARAGDVDNIFGDYFFNNAIKYVSPTWQGVTLEGIYSFGGIAGSMARNQVWGIAASYDRGSFGATVVYRRANEPAVSQFDASSSAVAGQTFANPSSNPMFSGYLSARSLEVYGAGLRYKFGSSVVAANYTTTRFNHVLKTSSTPIGGISPSINSAELNYTYRFTPELLIGAGFSYTHAEDAKYTQSTIGSTYSLSKRTFLYAMTSWVHAIGTNSLNRPAVAGIDLLTASSNANQLAVRIGIHHNF